MSRYNFRTVGGEKFTVEVEINEAAVANYLAARLCGRGKTKMTALEGAIVARKVPA